MLKYFLIFLLSGLALFFSTAVEAKELLSFSGNINFEKKEALVEAYTPDKGKAKFYIKAVRQNIFRFTADLEHVKTPWFDISSNVRGGLTILRGLNKENIIQGKVNSYYTLVDYKPYRDLEFIFQVSKNELILQKLVFGPLSGKAAMLLRSPYILDGRIELSSASLPDFLSLWVPERRFDSGGPLTASIRFQGSLDKIYVRVHAESRDGFIKHFYFDKMILNFDGVYPRLYISDANIIDKNGMGFSMIGPFDLSEPKNIKQQIEALTLTPLIVDSEHKSEWTIRRFEGKDDNATTSFKAFLDKSGPGLGSSGIIGVERKIEF